MSEGVKREREEVSETKLRETLLRSDYMSTALFEEGAEKKNHEYVSCAFVWKKIRDMTRNVPKEENQKYQEYRYEKLLDILQTADQMKTPPISEVCLEFGRYEASFRCPNVQEKWKKEYPSYPEFKKAFDKDKDGVKKFVCEIFEFAEPLSI